MKPTEDRSLPKDIPPLDILRRRHPVYRTKKGLFARSKKNAVLCQTSERRDVNIFVHNLRISGDP